MGMDWYVMPLLLLIGFFFGSFIEKMIKKGEKISFLGENLATFFAETIYFAFLFSIPLSKNIPLFFLNLVILLYVKVHTFGREYFEDKPEDRVESKWYPKFP